MSRRLAVIAASSLILLAACGSDPSTSDTTAAAVEDTSTPAAEPGTIVEVAQAGADFSTLVSAVVAAGLAETLSGEGPFTVFAPTNEAFAALPPGLLDKLLLPENKDILVKILTYHVVAGKVMAADVTAGDVATVEGSTFAVTTDMGVKVGGASVVTTDVPASNGVIHVIDKVIVPPTVDVAAL
ncbi:MAG: fasciclin domain-containing protein [Actinobacteria bacterium]|nr:fasciclin domain-containing protein [Actinomycetota bacterium]